MRSVIDHPWFIVAVAVAAVLVVAAMPDYEERAGAPMVYEETDLGDYNASQVNWHIVSRHDGQERISMGVYSIWRCQELLKDPLVGVFDGVVWSTHCAEVD